MDNTMTLFETIVDQLSGKEFTKEDLQQIQERHQVARRQAVTRQLDAIKIPPLNSTKFTEAEWQKHHAMKDARIACSTLWQELYSNEEDCNKIMEIDNAEQRMERKRYEQRQEEESKRKKSFSKEELKLNYEKYQKEKRVKLMRRYGIVDK